MHNQSFLGWLGYVVVIVVGWVVVHVLSNRRDRDKARREMLATSVDDVSRALTELIGDARAYHLESRDKAREVKLKMTLQDLGMRLTALDDLDSEHTNLARCRGDLGVLRRAITGAHFEDEHLAPMDESDQILQEIADALLRCQRSLLTAKHAQFPA